MPAIDSHPPSDGFGSPREALSEELYERLRTMAVRALRHGHRGASIDACSLVHEAWIQMVPQDTFPDLTREEFLSLAARMMRRCLIDSYRKRNAGTRDGAVHRVSLHDSMRITAGPSIDLIALDDALRLLEEVSVEAARALELRFFGGLELQQIAGVMTLSVTTVQKRLRFAHAWLARQLSSAQQSDRPEEVAE